MILSDLQNWDREKQFFPAIIDKAITYIRSNDLQNMPVGTYPIDGRLMYAMIQETSTWDNQNLEFHASYVDVQYLVSGAEKIGFIRAGEQVDIVEDALGDKDYLFARFSGRETDIVMKPGMFVVFFPSDLHRPCCHVDAETRIKKAVVKIHLTLFPSV